MSKQTDEKMQSTIEEEKKEEKKEKKKKKVKSDSDPEDTDDDLIDFNRPRNTILVGKKHSGKTNLTRYLLLNYSIQKKKFKFGIVFTNTKFDEEYIFMPDEYIIQGYDKPVFMNYIKQLEDFSKKNKKRPPSNFMVFDDLVGVLREDKEFINFICNHRHYSTSVFLSAQYLKKGIPTTMRECIDYGFFFNSKTEQTLKALYESFGQLFGDYKTFRNIFMNNTKEKFQSILYRAEFDDIDNAYKKFKSPDMSKHKKIKIEF